MLKTWLIGLKDVKLAFRDRAALLLMLAAPFLLTLGLGLVTGRFSGNQSSGLADIPVVIVNMDGEDLGDTLVDVLQSEELAGLLEPTLIQGPAAARLLIDEDEAAAAVIIPAGFTRSIIPQDGLTAAEPVKIEIYANPARPTSSGIVQTIVDEYLSRVEEGRTTGMTAILQLVNSGRIPPEQAAQAGARLEQTLQSGASGNDLAIRVDRSTAAAQETVVFDPLAYIAPGMALMFLMFTVTYGGRSIFAEKNQGTLPRLLISPTASMQILGGKVLGIFLTGAAQMLTLIGASFLFFQLKWGDPLAVVVLVLAAVFGATGWGLLLTSISRTQAQVANMGTALMLIFSILGGSFISLEQMPPTIQAISKITPNAWALDGFVTLGLNGRLADIGAPVLALLGMGAALFVLAAFLFRKNPVIS